MNENVSLIYTFGYLVKKDKKNFIKLELSEEDDIVDSGLVIGPYYNNLSKAYFVGNSLILKKFNNGESQEIIFRENNFEINNSIFNYSDLELKLTKDNVYLSVNDFFILELSSSLINLLEEYNIKVSNSVFNYKIIVYNETLYLQNTNTNKIEEINLLNNILSISDTPDEYLIHCTDYNKEFLLDDCLIKTIIEDNLYNVIIQVEDNNMLIPIGYSVINN